MMARHVAICPLKYADRDMPLSTEPVLAFDDPASDTVVIAEPDLLYWDGGGRVWRETKTTGYIADRSGKDSLEVYPQAALALVLLAEGALGGDHCQVTGGTGDPPPHRTRPGADQPRRSRPRREGPRGYRLARWPLALRPRVHGQPRKKTLRELRSRPVVPVGPPGPSR